MKITVLGCGYVGLVTATCLAELGNNVTCMDVDQKKVDQLNQGVIPIYEPGLESMLLRNAKAGRLTFISDLSQESSQADIYYVAVGTPSTKEGMADLKYVISAVKMIGQHIDHYCVIVDKSTVPIGVADKVREAVQAEINKRQLSVEFDVVSNPEFLKEGTAIQDFMKPDRLVVGYPSEKSRQLLDRLYDPIIRTSGGKMLYMSVKDAEMTKYAVNAMLATRISFMNELATLCERFGIDVDNVRLGIGSDSRIGEKFLFPGCGYGGSCFPKDVKALIHMAKEKGFDPTILEAVEVRNQSQKQRLHEKVSAAFGNDLSGKTFALWGLAFKPGTDDMREASAVTFLHHVIGQGAKVLAFDPVAQQVAKRELPSEWFASGQLQLVDDMYLALHHANALIIATEWQNFLYPDLEKMQSQMKQAVIIDGRNIFNPTQMIEAGFVYSGIGRGLNDDALKAALLEQAAAAV